MAGAEVVGVSTDPGVWGAGPPTAGGEPDDFLILERLRRH